MQKRMEYLVDLTDPNRDPLHQKRVPVDSGVKGNLFSSELVDMPGYHAPALDINNMEVTLVESSTPGNFHLYIDKPMTWEQYKNLLIALGDAGICQEGFVGLSIARGASFLRQPGVQKMPEDVLDS